MTRPMKRMLLIAAAVVFSLGFYKYWTISAAIAANSNFQPPPEAVTSAVAHPEKWNDQLQVVGSLEAVQGAVLAAEEKGKVVAVNFENGSQVKAGAVLVQLDTSVEAAQLKSAEARAQLARVNFVRAKTLRERNANSQADLDNAKAQLDESEADVAALKATIDRKMIRAPFAGRAGIRMVNVGQFVDVATKVVPLYSVDPMYLNFAVPQQQILSVVTGQLVEFTVDAFPGEKFTGKITAIDPAIQSDTRNVQVQATVMNSSERLKPGMFAQTRVELSQSRDVVVIPASSISYAPYGDSVYVIKRNQPDSPMGGVEQRFVQLGSTRGDQVAVLKGLQAGDEVVSSGLFKMRPGVTVAINNSVTPSNNPAPTPEDT